MPAIPLKPDAWQRHSKGYPDTEVINTLVGIARYGARIGFSGIRTGQRIAKNLSSADELPIILMEDIAEQERHERLMRYNDIHSLPPFFFSSPLGLVDKPNGKKRRIHHLSHPPGDSVNDGIPEHFGEI